MSYLLVTLVLISCNGVTYLHSRRMLIANQNMENDKIAEQIEKKFTDIMNTMDAFGSSILLEEEINSMGKTVQDGSIKMSYMKYTLFKKLGNYKRINGSYSEIMLYFRGQDYVVASDSANTAENYWRIYNSENSHLDWEQWIVLLQGKYDGLSMLTYGDDIVFFVKTIQDNKWDRTQINIIFMFERNELENILFTSKSRENFFLIENLLVPETAQDILMDTNYVALGQEDKETLKDAVGQNIQRTKLPDSNQNVYLKYYDSYPGYRLILYGFDGIYFNSIQAYQRSILLLFGFSILFSMLSMIYFLGRDYGQVSVLLNLLKITSEEAAGIDEFVVIEGKFAQIQKDLKAADSQLQRQNNMFRNEYLIHLLKGDVRENAQYVEELYGIKWNSSQYTVLLFYAEEINTENSREWESVCENNLDLELVRFIFSNVYHELFAKENCVVYHLVVDECLVLIVNLPSEDALKNKNVVLEVMAQGEDFIDSHLDIRYWVSAGEISTGREHLTDAYQEAIRVMELKRMYELHECLFYSDLKLKPTYGYYYPIELERELVRQIGEANAENAVSIVQKIYDENEKNNIYNILEMSRYLTLDIWCTVLKALNGDEKMINYFGSLKPDFWRKAANVCQLRDELLAMIKSICEYRAVNLKREIQSEEEICRNIVAYIKQNISDSNMSVGSIADHFLLSSAGMSKTFRKVMNQKLPTYITSMRVEMTKEILLKNSYNLNEIAEMVGFGSVRTLLRSFKQIEGMTPSQWKEKR